MMIILPFLQIVKHCFLYLKFSPGWFIVGLEIYKISKLFKAFFVITELLKVFFQLKRVKKFFYLLNSYFQFF